jgi:UDP-glucose 4-epimerase
MNILVTGGAGYIGSQVVLDLARNGHQPIIFDNLSKGHKEAVKAGLLIEGDLCDSTLIKKVLTEEKIDAVIHLAAYSLVGESVQDPQKYFQNNIGNGMILLDAMLACNVKYFVLSSTAAVYGEPDQIPITEEHPKKPTNPYGFSKLTLEGILDAYDRAYGLRYISLRYFNAAGADPEVEIGEDHNPESHLIPIVLQAALGIRPNIQLFGNDYPTPDGTCIRDYIHVADLSQAHILALQSLIQGGASRCFNLGIGHGYSNLQVIETARKVTGKQINVIETPRRPGDPAVLVASSDRIKRELGWNPKYSGLDEIIETAWKWSRSHPKGYNKTN